MATNSSAPDSRSLGPDVISQSVNQQPTSNQNNNHGQLEDPQDVQDVTQFVQTLLQQVQDRFQTMSDQILNRIDEMGTRIDDLERNLNDLMTNAGIQPESDSSAMSTSSSNVPPDSTNHSK